MKKPLIIVLSIIVVIVVALYFVVPKDVYIISGESMSPTYHASDKLKTDKNFSSLSRGDVVVYSAITKDGKKAELIHRIVGLPGEKINIKDGIIYINGSVISVPPIAEVKSFDGIPANIAEVVLKSSQYYVIGDNTERAADSRFFGPVNKTDIIALVVGR